MCTSQSHYVQMYTAKYTHTAQMLLIYHGLVGVHKRNFTVHRPHVCVCVTVCLTSVSL